MHIGVGREAAVYGARHLSDARAVFLFRGSRRLDVDHRDVPRQKELLRAAFAGMHPDVDRWLDELEHATAFYFDSITQLRLDSWSRGRVTLVGDAGYCPGRGRRQHQPRRAGRVRPRRRAGRRGRDHERAYPAYEREMGELARRSRAFARGVAKTLIPGSSLGVRALVGSTRLLSALPTPIGRAIAKANDKGLRLHDSVRVKDYPGAGT